MHKLIFQSLLLSVVFTSTATKGNFQNPENCEPPIYNNQLAVQSLEMSSNAQLNNLREQELKWRKKINEYNINNWHIRRTKFEKDNDKLSVFIYDFNKLMLECHTKEVKLYENYNSLIEGINKWVKKVRTLDEQPKESAPSDNKERYITEIKTFKKHFLTFKALIKQESELKKEINTLMQQQLSLITGNNKSAEKLSALLKERNKLEEKIGGLQEDIGKFQEEKKPIEESPHKIIIFR